MLERADRLALEAERPDLAALCLNYLAIARVEAGEADAGWRRCATASRWRWPAGTTRSSRAATRTSSSCCARWAGSTSSSAACATGCRSRASAASGRTPTTSRSTAACCSLRRGDWDGARSGAARAGRGRGRRHRGSSTPTPCRGSGGCSRGAATRRAEALLAEAWERAQRARRCVGLAYAGLARAEWAWLAGDVAAARRGRARAAARALAHPGGRRSAASCCATSRAPGWHGASRSPDCPPALRGRACVGEWRTAAAIWRRAGDPYETALELALSGEPDAIADGLEILDRLGATPAAELARAGLEGARRARAARPERRHARRTRPG